MKNKIIEELYDTMQEKIINEIERDKELETHWKELLKLEEELNNTLSKPEIDIFDEYLTKEAQVIDCERKKAFGYGYNLSNKLMIDSLRE